MIADDTLVCVPGRGENRGELSREAPRVMGTTQYRPGRPAEPCHFCGEAPTHALFGVLCITTLCTICAAKARERPALVEISDQQADMLRSCGAIMQRESEEQAPGWFGRYLRAHKHAHTIAAQIFKRAHATPGTPHGEDPPR